MAPRYISYSTVAGYFDQDDPSAPEGQQSAVRAFGLINRSYDTDEAFDPKHEKTQWQRFGNFISHINTLAPQNTRYKIIFLGRHGEGVHNVAEAFYGTAAWDCYWSMRDGNGTLSWSDALLTTKGKEQAHNVHEKWVNAIADEKISTPESYYVSPLTRCLETARITFAGLVLAKEKPFTPTVKELLREGIGIHTCDRRSTKAVIQKNYPSYLVESGFSEKDLLWTAELRESGSAQVAREKALLDDVFENDASMVISFTAHGGTISSILKVIGHRPFDLGTGGVVPVIIKAEWIDGTPPVTSIEPSLTAPPCTSDPTAKVWP